MEIKLPKLSFHWNGTDHDAAHEIIRRYIRFAVYISPFALWKIWELASKYLGM